MKILDLAIRFKWILFVLFQIIFRMPFFLRAEARIQGDEALHWLIAEMNLRGEHFTLHPFKHAYLGITESIFELPFVPFFGNTAVAIQLGLCLAFVIYAYFLVKIAEIVFGRFTSLLVFCLLVLPNSFALFMSASYLGGHFGGSVFWVAGIYFFMRVIVSPDDAARRKLAFIFTGGLLWGIAHYSSHLHKIGIAGFAVTTAVAVFYCLPNARVRIAGLAALFSGLLIGLIPQFLGNIYNLGGLEYRNAIATLTFHFFPQNTLMLLLFGVPTMGGQYVDSFMDKYGFSVSSSIRPVAMLFLVYVFALIAAYFPIRVLVDRLKARKSTFDVLKPDFIFILCFVMTCGGNILAFVGLNVGAGPFEVRYLWPTIALTPIMLAATFVRLKESKRRLAIGTLVVFVLITVFGYARGYSRKGFHEYVGSPGSREVLDYLNEKNIHYSFAQHWILYNLVMYSGRKHLSAADDKTLGPLLDDEMYEKVLAASKKKEKVAIIQHVRMKGWFQKYVKNGKTITIPPGEFEILDKAEVKEWAVFTVRRTGDLKEKLPEMDYSVDIDIPSNKADVQERIKRPKIGLELLEFLK